jgi:hypothetical protein
MRTNWKTHASKIKKGDEKSFGGWLDAGVECLKKYNGNVTRYIADSGEDDKIASREKYILACVRALKKYGSVQATLVAYDKVYAYREISSFIAFAPDGQRKKNVKKQDTPTSAVTLTSPTIRKRLKGAGFSDMEIRAIEKALLVK